MDERVDVAATLTTDLERFAAQLLAMMLADDVPVDRAIVYVFAVLEAVERWRRKVVAHRH